MAATKEAKKSTKAKSTKKAPAKKKEGPGQVTGARVASAKLNDAKVKKIKAALKKGDSLAKLSNDYDVSRRTIACIRDGLTWKHVK